MGVTNPRLVGMNPAAGGERRGAGLRPRHWDGGDVLRDLPAQAGHPGIVSPVGSAAGLTGACILFVVAMASILSIRRVLVLEPAEVFR